MAKKTDPEKPKRREVYYGANSEGANTKTIDTPGKRVVKTKKTRGSGQVEKTKSVTKYGSKGSVTRDKRKLGNTPTENRVKGYDKSGKVNDIKYSTTGIKSAIAARKMMKKYK